MTYLRINGMDLYSEVRGEGPPVLLLHGGFCSLESLRAQSDALEADRTVYAFERLGNRAGMGKTGEARGFQRDDAQATHEMHLVARPGSGI